MSSKLPINLEDLLHQRTVEGDRIEFKAGWNPDPIQGMMFSCGNGLQNPGGGCWVMGRGGGGATGGWGAGVGKGGGLSMDSTESNPGVIARSTVLKLVVERGFVT